MSTKYKIIYSPLAADDLRSIYHHFTNKHEEKPAVPEAIHAIHTLMPMLECAPKTFPTFEKTTSINLELRKLSTSNFDVFYYIDTENNIVKIVRILHSGKDIDNILV